MKQSFTSANWPKLLALMAGALGLALGLTVIVGWHTHQTALLQIRPSFVAMVYNTALGFVLCGVAVLLITLGRPRLALIGGVYAIVMGLLTLSEIIFQLELGIDQFFMRHYVGVANAHPGRMAINTAIFFPLVGFGLLWMSFPRRFRARPLIVGIVGSITLAQGLVAFSGYLTGITTTYAWGNMTRMAIHTAFGFAMLGLGLIALAWQEHRLEQKMGAPRWLPLMVGVAIAAITLCLWQALLVDQHTQIKSTVEARTATVRNEIAAEIRAHTLALGRLAKRWQMKAMHDQKERELDAWIVIGDYEGFESIRWVDPADYVRWTVPLQAHTAEEGWYVGFEARRRATLEVARQTRQLTVSRPVELATGGTGFLVLVPLYNGEQFEGYINGVFRIDQLLNAVLAKDLTPGYAVVVSEGSDEIYRHGEANSLPASSWAHTEELALPGTNWRVTVWPEKQMLTALRSSAATMTLIIGLLISLIVAWTVRLAQSARRAAALKAGQTQVLELLATGGSLPDALALLALTIETQIPGMMCSILLLDEAGKCLRHGAAPSLPEEYNQAVDGLPIGPAAGSCGTAASRLERVIVEDIATDPLWDDYRELALRFNLRSCWSQPLISDAGQLLGTLSIYHHQPRATTRAEIEIIEIAAQLAGITITRKRIERDLEQARDAALESTRLKAEFLANMSHEIRTPMNGVIGMTGLLLETELSSPQQEYTTAIQSSADALLTIIDDILDFSKIESKQLRFEKIDFELREAIESPLELLAERAQAKGIEIASHVQQEVPTALRGDPGRLRQVLTNLIGNAVKFTEQGEVVVKVRTESATVDHVMLRFEISDTGIGISEEAQRRLFHAFTQADGSTTRKYGGTGLGLAISKQLVELMEGEIGIESTPGEGSTFWFTARFEKQSEPDLSAVETAAANLAGIRVLIVDDNATNRQILLHQTAARGMIATAADSGAQALELLHAACAQGEPYRIAILDLMMPGMDGFQLAQAIKSDATIAPVALVLLPSFGKHGHGEAARQAGIAAYLQKPVRPGQLYNCLAALMAQPAGHDQATPSRLITRHSLRETEVKRQAPPAVSSIRILVAEDNPVNQLVALGQLEFLGYQAEAVENGREALQALERAPFDIILMDCQMPEMDGFAATAEIRRREGTGRRTPIIAMTANAVEGDREVCLAAGMDDYISKPVKPEALSRKLEQWIKPNENGSSAPPRSEAEKMAEHHDRPGIVDLSVLADLREMQRPGEPDFVTRLIDMYLHETASELKVLRAAISRHDGDEQRRVAQLLKGNSANIGAVRMVTFMEELEDQGLDEAAAEAWLVNLDYEFEQVREALTPERQVLNG